MDIVEVAGKIENKIILLEQMRKNIRQLAIDKANAIGEYRRARAHVLIRLRNGIAYELDGDWIENPAVSGSLQIASGICWKEKIKEQEGIELYKAGLTVIESIKAELNGYQSIFRHLEDAP